MSENSNSSDKAAYLKWKPVYSVGNNDLDNQHKYMFELLNSIYAALQVGKSEQTIEQLLEKARLYGKLHFETEEKLLAGCGYPRWWEHRQVHEDYVERVEAMSRTVGADTAFELFLFLKEWWINHITSMDADYSSWINKPPAATNS